MNSISLYYHLYAQHYNPFRQMPYPQAPPIGYGSQDPAAMAHYLNNIIDKRKNEQRRGDNEEEKGAASADPQAPELK